MQTALVLRSKAEGLRKSNLAMQVHGENPRALPVAGKGRSERLLHRPRQEHPAATGSEIMVLFQGEHPRRMAISSKQVPLICVNSGLLSSRSM